MNTRKTLLITLLLISSWYSTVTCAQVEITLAVADSNELTVARYEATGKYLAIWLAPEYGFREAHHTMAQLLTEQQIEVWQSNIIEALFLPQSVSSLRQLDGRYIADLIEYAHVTTGKKIILMGDSYASINVLTGAHQWQSRKQPGNYLIGAILFSPYTYAYIPSLGLEPEFMPVIDSTNIPLMIYQAKNGGNINQFNKTLGKLQQHNNPVYSKYMPDIISLFHDTPPSELMKKTAKQLSPNIKKMITILQSHKVPATPIPLSTFSTQQHGRGIDFNIKEFKGDIEPLAINLLDTNDEPYIRNEYTGKITVINFWATWCGPCVEEIPSLNRLKQKMKDLPFELISIDYAEDKKTISDFMQKINVEYPVLIDKDGAFAKQWKVISYPSTFIIDPQGKIRYGVNSAIHWDDPDLIDTLKALLPNND